MRIDFRIVVCALAVVAALRSVSVAQTSYPMLMSIKPVATRVSDTSEHTIQSRYSLAGAYEVLVSGEGVRGTVVTPEPLESDQNKNEKDRKANVEKLKVRFTVDAGALPGVRDFRIATPNGVSTVGQLVVGRDPVTYESDKNDTPDQAQQVSLPATLCGAIEKAEDVDYFKFNVESGTSLCFHVRAQRLQDRIHDLQAHVDPIITLRNSSGTILAAADNDFFADPLLQYRFEQSGEYLLEIRDVRYQGNNYWEYSVEVSDRPFVVNVFPMAIQRGEQRQLELIGYQLPAESASIHLPMDVLTGPRWQSLLVGGSLTNPAPLLVSDSESLIVEPDSPNNDVASASPISIPGDVTGRISTEGDIDCFVLEGKKGERYAIEVVARRQQSRLDSHLRLLDAAGKQLAQNDDLKKGNSSFSDSEIEDWAVPEDGKYIIEVRDLHLRGGPGFVYVLRVRQSRPQFELFVDTDKTLVTPGTAGITYVRAVRRNGFQGEIQLAIDNLPHGVTATCGRILPQSQDGCVVFWADYDAPLSAENVRIKGTGVHQTPGSEPLMVSAIASPLQEIYQPGGGRGHWPVDTHTVSVGAPNDLRGVMLSTYDIRLKPGESKKIDVRILRAEGFDKNVTLDVTYNHLTRIYGDSLPTGVKLDSKNSKTLLTGTTSDGAIVLTAAATAGPVEKQLFAVMANVSINFVMKTTYASLPVYISIEPAESTGEKKEAKVAQK